MQQKKLLSDTFSQEKWQQIPYLLKELWKVPDFYFDSVSQIQMDRWSVGRTVLMGDAAYCASPASGQGTSLALVGAYVLAGELAEVQGDYRCAFARYEQAMREYVIKNQQLAGPGAPQLFARRRIIRLCYPFSILELFFFLPG